MPRHRHHLIVACMPKSGSTFLASALTHATGYSNVVFAFGFEQNEQDLYLPALIRNAGIDTVTQQHMRATDPNLRLLAAFHMSPIVLVRNLEDITISLYDHLHKTAIKASMGYLNESFFELDRDNQLDLLISMFLPWYISFFVSWVDAERNGKCRPIWMKYEDMISDTSGAVHEILTGCGIARSREAVQAAIGSAMRGDVKMNKGVSGRGRQSLNQQQIARIWRLASHYPRVDFSMIGGPTAVIKGS